MKRGVSFIRNGNPTIFAKYAAYNRKTDTERSLSYA